MIFKYRTIPRKLVGLEALIRRLPSDHKDLFRIEEEYRRRSAGFQGEEDFDKHFLEFRPHYPIAILHDICLRHNGIFFQMDSLLITPASIILFEVKNLAGKIIVKNNPTQFIQENPEGQFRVIKSPISELERKETFMKAWLNNRDLNIPIAKIVVFAYLNELNIEKTPETRIAFTHEIPTILYNMPIQESILTNKEIYKIAKEMRNDHCEYNPFPLIETMNLDKTDIKSGVFCPQCSYRGMRWEDKSWRCDKCRYSAIDCHLPLVKDWFYLLNNELTNRELRLFANIDNRNIAKRLLSKSKLIMKGSRRNAYYVMEE